MIEEYIQLMADKAQGHDKMFNWETATYGEVYYEDLDSFTHFEIDFPAIVNNDASTSNQNLSSESTVLSYDESKSSRVSERAFMTLFGQDNETFTSNVKKSVAERAHHQRHHEIRMNNRHMQTQESKIDSGGALDVVSSQALDADLVVMESNETESRMHDTSSSLGNYITHAVDANIRPVNVWS
nr:hypothetical protein [Tanacetum cinerariifolium]